MGGIYCSIRAVVEDTDPDFLRHSKVLRVCIDNRVSLPKETAEYFECPHDVGVNGRYSFNIYEYFTSIKLERKLIEGKHYVEYNKPHGLEVDIASLPKGITKLRFVCAD